MDELLSHISLILLFVVVVVAVVVHGRNSQEIHARAHLLRFHFHTGTQRLRTR